MISLQQSIEMESKESKRRKEESTSKICIFLNCLSFCFLLFISYRDTVYDYRSYKNEKQETLTDVICEFIFYKTSHSI